MDTVRAGRAVVDLLKAEGVRFVFGLPGGHVLGIYDALYDTREITHVLVRHEHTAASMAAGYAQLTGEPGVCLVTAGPGCTNLLTGIAEAYVGCLPIVIVAGRATTANAHRGAAQEVATDRIFAPITKWSVRVYPDRPAVGFVGDGSFRMVMNVLPVAAEYRLPVTWCVFNDGALGSIRDIQQYRFDDRILGTEFEIQPDFAKIAEACGCFGERVEDPAEIGVSLDRALAANTAGRPAVLDFVVARERMLQSLEHYGFYPEELIERARRLPLEATT